MLHAILKQNENENVKEFVLAINSTFVNDYGNQEYSRSRSSRRFRQFRRETKKAWLLNGILEEIKPYVVADQLTGIKNWHHIIAVVQKAEAIAILQKKLEYKHQPTYLENSIVKDAQQVDEDGFLIIYTDGACLNNGRRDAKAGIGIWFGRDHPRNLGEPLLPCANPTNNIAELQAVIKAIKLAKKQGIARIQIVTDSKYVKDGMESWIVNWMENGWKTANGSQVANKKMWEELLVLVKGINIKWEWVESHSGIEGNEGADRLAQEGAKKYRPMVYLFEEE